MQRLRHRKYHVQATSRLPDDILLLIFQELTYSSRPMLPNRAAFDLSAVCNHWRSLAISCSSLWTMVVADFAPHRGAADIDERRAIVTCKRALLQLERAGKQPLTFFLNLNDVKEDTYLHPTIPQFVRQLVDRGHADVYYRLRQSLVHP